MVIHISWLIHFIEYNIYIYVHIVQILKTSILDNAKFRNYFKINGSISNRLRMNEWVNECVNEWINDNKARFLIRYIIYQSKSSLVVLSW